METNPEIIEALRGKNLEPKYARNIKRRGGRPRYIFYCSLTRTPGVSPVIYEVIQLLLMPEVKIGGVKKQKEPSQFRHSSCNWYSPACGTGGSNPLTIPQSDSICQRSNPACPGNSRKGEEEEEVLKVSFNFCCIPLPASPSQSVQRLITEGDLHSEPSAPDTEGSPKERDQENIQKIIIIVNKRIDLHPILWFIRNKWYT